LHAAEFPTLDAAQIETLGRCTGMLLEPYRAGQPLFQCGERDIRFFVVKSGEVEIVARNSDIGVRSIFRDKN